MKRTLSRSLVLVLLLGSMLYSTAQDFSTIPSDEESAKALAYLGYATQPSSLVLATQLSDIAGVWRRYFFQSNLNASSNMAYQRINSDGKFILADMPQNTAAPYENWPHGSYTIEDDVFVLTVESEGSPPGCETGRFEARVYRYGGQPVALLLTAIEENCPGRSESYPFIWVAPAD